MSFLQLIDNFNCHSLKFKELEFKHICIIYLCLFFILILNYRYLDELIK